MEAGGEMSVTVNIYDSGASFDIESTVHEAGVP
jgi:hypothetical protein